VRELCLRLLARREHSARELERKLRARGCDATLIGEILLQLQQERLLSDDRFAYEYARSRSNNGYGPVRIRAELRERGVEARVGELLELDEDAWAARAADVRRKRFGTELPRDVRERARQYRFLGNRGFDAEHIRRALAGEVSDQDETTIE
jgi:regulatory protein